MSRSRNPPPRDKLLEAQKIKAFHVGQLNLPAKGKTQKEKEKQKLDEDEQAVAKYYEEFADSFDEEEAKKKAANMMWVRGGTVEVGKGEKAATSKFYKPTSKLSDETKVKSEPSTKKEKRFEKELIALKVKSEEKKKLTNLEQFKEELKRAQTERQQRKQLKATIDRIHDEAQRKVSRFDAPSPQVAPVRQPLIADQFPAMRPFDLDDYISGTEADPHTTNLYIGNISPSMTEPEMMRLFGRFGPLASVKIMWPRTDEEKLRGKNCGFVAYMNRRDAEKALDMLNTREIRGFELRVGWGKGIPIPSYPVYIPEQLDIASKPPPPSGLPFNAQPKAGVPTGPNQTLQDAVIRVVQPTDRLLLHTIHRIVEFVVREGPMFEAMIMNREINNGLYKFLFDNKSPAHVYYRWRLYSILQGDSPTNWRTCEFQMFEGGSIWRPPQPNPYLQGLPEDLYPTEEDLAPDETGFPNLGGAMSSSVPSFDSPDRPRAPKRTRAHEVEVDEPAEPEENHAEELQNILGQLTAERGSVADAMIWCLQHASRAEEVVMAITEAMSQVEATMQQKLARLFLVSDILHNAGTKVQYAAFYRKHFQSNLPVIMMELNGVYEAITSRLRADQFKQRVMSCFRAWEDWNIYPQDFLIQLQNVFLGLFKTASDSEEAVSDEPVEELDGEPVHMEDLDGEPLEEQRVTAAPSSQPSLTEMAPAAVPFKKTTWAPVHEDDLEKQAVTTSKWDNFDQEPSPAASDEDLDGELLLSLPVQTDMPSPEGPLLPTVADRLSPQMNDERRAKMRDIEVKVMTYQDDLENGDEPTMLGKTVQQQVAMYREKIVKEMERELNVPRAYANSPDDRTSSSSKKKRSRSPKEKKSKKKVDKSTSSPPSSSRRERRDRSRSPDRKSSSSSRRSGRR